MDLILKTAPRRRTIQICTDSQAALMAIESSKVKSRLILDCKKILHNLASCNRVIPHGYRDTQVSREMRRPTDWPDST
ncbi:hypothetical protein NQ318_010861 [Aromia moschata]|uniref:RNase H type-1 domain-containing protein n=1 Tax=Aromia moschata TaxID=1265417 RepID=A0AAV8XP58_9CUCU|nr:hypothetical protein NQ318_010861 [Aromia moschata]